MNKGYSLSEIDLKGPILLFLYSDLWPELSVALWELELTFIIELDRVTTGGGVCQEWGQFIAVSGGDEMFLCTCLFG